MNTQEQPAWYSGALPRATRICLLGGLGSKVCVPSEKSNVAQAGRLQIAAATASVTAVAAEAVWRGVSTLRGGGHPRAQGGSRRAGRPCACLWLGTRSKCQGRLAAERLLESAGDSGCSSLAQPRRGRPAPQRCCITNVWPLCNRMQAFPTQ